MVKTWDEIKKLGNPLYKTGGIEPIDLYRNAGALRHFALCSIIKYAFRNMGEDDSSETPNGRDMDKIIHYAEMLKSVYGELQEVK